MLPIVMPKATIVKRSRRSGKRHTVVSLCREAGVECRVTGPAANRTVYVDLSSEPYVEREPGPFGAVAVGVQGKSSREQALLALGYLAYVVFDYAARESLCGRPEAAMSLPVGRPRKARALSGAERQKRWRQRRSLVKAT
jgi:hypothetical protein